MISTPPIDTTGNWINICSQMETCPGTEDFARYLLAVGRAGIKRSEDNHVLRFGHRKWMVDVILLAEPEEVEIHTLRCQVVRAKGFLPDGIEPEAFIRICDYDPRTKTTGHVELFLPN